MAQHVVLEDVQCLKPKQTTHNAVPTNIMAASCVQAVEHVSKKWDELDTELANAIMRIAAGSLRREIFLYSESRRQGGSPVSGRAIEYLFLQRYDMDRGQVRHVDLAALIQLQYRNDLEAYLDDVENVLLGMSKMPDPELLHAIVVPQLRKCKALEPEFVSYDRASEGSEERTAQYMLDSARQTVSRRRRAETEASMLGSRVQVSL